MSASFLDGAYVVNFTKDGVFFLRYIFLQVIISSRVVNDIWLWALVEDNGSGWQRLSFLYQANNMLLQRHRSYKQW